MEHFLSINYGNHQSVGFATVVSRKLFCTKPLGIYLVFKANNFSDCYLVEKTKFKKNFQETCAI